MNQKTNKMIKEITTILIANRGEITKRVASTAAQMGIQTIGVFAEDERDSKGLPPYYIQFCDQAVSLGEGALSETFLNIDKIVSIAKKHGAQAIHPG